LTIANLAHVRQSSLFRTVDRFICVSQRLRDIHVAAGFPAEKMIVKYHGIDLPADAGVHYSGQKQVLFVGRLNSAKGTAVLRELPDLLPDYAIHIVGAGPDLSMLETRYAQHGNLNVTILGRLSPDQVRAQLSASACVVIPSMCPESFGLVAAEAMSVGTPIVASDIGALTELLHQSGGGMVVPCDQGAVPYARAIRNVVENEGASRGMAAAGLRFAQQRLSLPASARALEQVYVGVTEPRQVMAVR
jgi:glycosyltransferase involved in cell wall biosynthesis